MESVSYAGSRVWPQARFRCSGWLRKGRRQACGSPGINRKPASVLVLVSRAIAIGVCLGLGLLSHPVEGSAQAPLLAQIARVEASGPVTLSNVSMSSECERVADNSHCRSEVGFDLLAREGLILTAADLDTGDTVRINGVAMSSEGTPLQAGQSVQVVVSDLSMLVWSETPALSWVTPPLAWRHPWIAADAYATPIRQHAILSRWVGGTAPVELEGNVQHEVRGDDRVTLCEELVVPANGCALVFDAARPPEPTGFQLRGGPFVGFGPTEDENGVLRGALRVGFEVELFGQSEAIAAFSLETDFDALIEAATIELASPGFVVFPSIGVGAGVVARQFGSHPADVGIRLRGVVSFGMLTIVGDIDRWFSAGIWRYTGALRLGF